jgi:hypothetical protein
LYERHNESNGMSKKLSKNNRLPSTMTLEATDKTAAAMMPTEKATATMTRTKKAIAASLAGGTLAPRTISSEPIATAPVSNGHPLADIFPMMGADDIDALARDIQINGLLETVVVFEKKILDGRGRHWGAS